MVAVLCIACSIIFLPLFLLDQLLSPLFLYCFTPKSIFLIPSRIDLTISYHLQSSLATWSGPILLFPPHSLSLSFFFASVPLYILLPRIISIGTSPFSLLLALDDLHKACRATPQLDAALMIWYVITAELLKR